MLAELRSQGPLAVVDAGFSLNKTGIVPQVAGALEQRQIKASLIAESMALGGLDAMALGADDWRLGSEFVMALVKTHDLPVLAANLTCGATSPFPATKVVQVGDKTIGLVGVTGGPVPGCEVGEVHAAVVAAVDALPPVDVVVGLIPVQNDRDLSPIVHAGDLPVDIVVDGRGKPPRSGGDRRAGAWFVGAGTRGKSLGVMRLTFVDPEMDWVVSGLQDQAEARLQRMKSQLQTATDRLGQAADPGVRERYQRQIDAYGIQVKQLEAQIGSMDPAVGNQIDLDQVDLDAKVADHPATHALVAGAKSKITMAGSADPRKFVPRIVAAGPFAGGEVCAGCHAEEHQQWSRTGHARAWAVLVDEDRAMDHECWSCHVTGAGQSGGPPAPTASAGYRDVQCEACHGPARDHVDDPDQFSPVRDPDVAVCVACHDGDQDGGRFDFDSYRPGVVHGSAEPAPAAP